MALGQARTYPKNVGPTLRCQRFRFLGQVESTFLDEVDMQNRCPAEIPLDAGVTPDPIYGMVLRTSTASLPIYSVSGQVLIIEKPGHVIPRAVLTLPGSMNEPLTYGL